MKRIVQRLASAAAALAIVAAGSSVAVAHTDPPGATSAGVSLSLDVMYNNGTSIPAEVPVTECETIKVNCTLAWNGGTDASLEGGTITITSPDGVPHDVTGGTIDCLGSSATSTDDPNHAVGQCLGSDGAHTSITIDYTVDAADIDGFGNVNFECEWSGGIKHRGTNDQDGGTASISISTPVEPCEDDGLYCNGTPECDPEAVWGAGGSRLGQCVAGTPVSCPDTFYCSTAFCDEALNRCNTSFEGEKVCDNVECEICDEGLNTCVDRPDAPPSCNPQEVEICRTPGFWGTHAGDSKRNSTDITQAVIDAADRAIVICGECITNTNVNNSASAQEAMCASKKGDDSVQLARHLTAAALNCVMTNGNADCSGVSIGDIFEACNEGCAAGEYGEGYSASYCRSRIDCFNNGGDWYDGMCWLGICETTTTTYCNSYMDCPLVVGEEYNENCIPIPDNCHDQPLCSEASDLCFDANAAEVVCPGGYEICQNSPGPAGSSRDCNASNKTRCTVVGPGVEDCLVDPADTCLY